MDSTTTRPHPAAKTPPLEGAANIWVSNDRWANARTHKTFADDAVRLAGAAKASDQDKAIAIYLWALRVYGHGGGGCEGPKGKEQSLFDVWNHVHAYPRGLCDKWGRLLVELWMAYKGDWSPASKWARKVNTRTILYTSGEHCQSGLYWVDEDGVGRYHLFDAHLGFFAYDRSGKRVASPEEIDKDVTLLTAPSRLPEPFFIRSDVPPERANPLTRQPNFLEVFGDPPDYEFTYNRQVPLSVYKTGFDLRRGEGLRRQWHDDGKFVYAAGAGEPVTSGFWFDSLRHTYADGRVKDPYNYKYQAAYFKRGRRGYGNGYHEYSPPLTAGHFPAGAESASGLACGDTAAGAAALHPAAAGKPGQVVYRIHSIYPHAESFIEGEYLLAAAGRIDIDLSLDGGRTWSPVWSAAAPAARPRKFRIDIGKGAWDRDQPSTFNQAAGDWDARRFHGYRYHVRVRMATGGPADRVGLNRLTFRNTVMLNFGMLPTLVPGRNTISVEGDGLTKGCAVKVVYAWEEDGKPQTHTAHATRLPHRYVITVREEDPLKVRCRHFDLAVIDAGDVP